MCVWKAESLSASVSNIKCRKRRTVSGGEENVKVKPLQWSLSAAAGAQFKITEKLGYFMRSREFVYYFDDGSNVNTIRKEHPF